MALHAHPLSGNRHVQALGSMKNLYTSNRHAHQHMAGLDGGYGSVKTLRALMDMVHFLVVWAKARLNDSPWCAQAFSFFNHNARTQGPSAHAPENKPSPTHRQAAH